MKISILNQERKVVANTLSEKTGCPMQYLGAPSFSYQVGSYLVKRDNTVEVDEEQADKALLRELHLQGVIDNSWDDEREVLDIQLPLDVHTGATLTNLVKIIFCRSEIISKAIGCSDAFNVSERLIEALAEQKPETIADFLTTLEAKGGNDALTGLEFEPNRLHFTGFSATTEPDTVKAYMELASLINQMALKQKYITLEKPSISNEKYSFRVWLLRLGMIGDEYKTTRKVLLAKLSGHSAFRTKEAEEKAKDKNKARREAAKEKDE